MSNCRRISTGGSLDYCLVSLLDKSKVEGVAHDCAVEFKDQVHFFCSQHCMYRFLAAPERYSLKVRHFQKCPPPEVTRRSQFEINRMLHRQGTVAITPFLEQSISPTLQDALVAFASDGRPVHPCLSERHSALLYTALFLKARNPASSEVQHLRWQKKLELFLADCRHGTLIQSHAVRGSPRNVAGLSSFCFVKKKQWLT